MYAQSFTQSILQITDQLLETSFQRTCPLFTLKWEVNSSLNAITQRLSFKLVKHLCALGKHWKKKEARDFRDKQIKT